MSKYDKLWEYISSVQEDSLTLSFDEIGVIVAVAIDHSFLQYKKELLQYGWTVKKISMKEQKVTFEKCKTEL